MTLSTENPAYFVQTFLDMQRALGKFLNEAYNQNGKWTVEEKKNYLNMGVMAVASVTMQPLKLLNTDVTGTQADPGFSFLAPPDILKPYKLWIADLEHDEISDEDWFRLVVSLKNQTTFSGRRQFWWDEGERLIRISPGVVTRSDVVFRYVRAPKKLEKDDDVSDLHPLTHILPSLWAAWRMLYRDEEHGDRGRAARADFREGVRDYIAFKNKNFGSRQERIVLDSGVYPHRRDMPLDVDPGSSFDLFDFQWLARMT